MNLFEYARGGRNARGDRDNHRTTEEDEKGERSIGHVDYKGSSQDLVVALIIIVSLSSQYYS